jgi:hypothetical protein
MLRRTFTIGTLMVLALAGFADAKPKRADGGACDSTGSARKTGTDDQGNKVDCLWDTCTFTECGTSGGEISGCVKKTEYSNARDCKAAARTGPKGTRNPGLKERGILQRQ